MAIQQWSLAVALLLCSTVCCAAGYCTQGSEWIEYNRNCYYWSRTTAENWFKAELTCQKSGGHLVSIGSLSDNNFLLRLTQCRTQFWVGMVNTVHSLKAQVRGYEWWDGRQHNYTALNPRTNDYFDCVYSDSVGKWYNVYCQYGYTFVCMAPASRSQLEKTDNGMIPDTESAAAGQQDVDFLQDQQADDEYEFQANSTREAITRFTTPRPTESPLRCPSGWQLLDNSCYYVTFNRTNYFNAQMSCQAVGATVTSILTPREHTLLTVAIGCNAPAWIGLEKARPCFKQPTKDHCWVWMDRSPTVHFDWAPSQSLDRRDAECVILDGQWKVVNCYAEYGYICKRHAYELSDKADADKQ